MPKLKSKALLSLLAASAGLMSFSASGQVTFIDVDRQDETTTVASPRQRPVRLTVAVLRFLPKSAKATPQFPTNGLLSTVVSTLSQQGQVNLLYLGERDLAGPDAVPARFDSSERRPAFSLNPDVNHSLTNREFGLHLKVAALPVGGNRLELHWSGSFSWSPNLIDQWAGEKYLLFGMRVAALLQPGAVYEEGGEEDEDAAPRGINIGGLFKKKPKVTNAAPVSVATDISFLAAERQEVPLQGKQIAQPDELVTGIFPIGDDPKQPGFIYVFQQFTWAD